MSLSFLFPLAWLGALAIGVPLWLHLERRRTTNVIRFSALQFLEDQPAARREPLWPRDWPLLLLRMLAILLLAAAFAWPYLPDSAPQAIVTRATVFILDNTLSHQAADQFQRAREQIAEVVERAERGEQVAVMELAAVPRVVKAFADDPQDAAARIRSLEPGHQRGSYRAALTAAADLLQSALGDQQKIVFYSDQQENQWSELRESGLLLNHVELVVAAPQHDALPNVALAPPRVRRVEEGGDWFVEGLLPLYHQGVSGEVVIELSLDGREAGRQTALLDGRPGSSVLPVRFAWPPGTWLRGQLEVRASNDSLLSDNQVCFSLPPIQEGTVALATSSKYLRVALSPEVMQSRWRTQVLTPDELADQSTAADVLCLDSSQLTLDGAKQQLQRQLHAGRGVVLLLDEVTPAIETVLRPLGIDVQRTVEDRDGGRLSFVFYDHPVLEPFRRAEFGNLLEVYVRRYEKVDMPGALPLVFSSQGDPLLLVGGAQGRLLVLAFGLDREDTNWPLHPTFIPLLDRCLGEARAMPVQQAQFHPGEACVWSVPKDQNVQSVQLRGDGDLIRSVEVDRGQARIVLPDAPGCYALHYDGSPEVRAVLDVNPSPDESQLKYTDLGSTLAEQWNAQRPRAEAVRPVKAPATRASILRQRIWWWLILAAAAALAVETLWLAWRRESSHAVRAAH